VFVSWIGLPFSNQRFFLLDVESMSPVEPGKPGELFISGAAVAEGYLNADASTAFLKVNLPWLDNGRETILYRTGDLAIWDASHRDLTFISRVDKTQLKISGIRIEPMEIESVMVNMTDILLAAVVSAIESPLSGGMLLVAYLQLVDPSNAPAALSTLRSRLQQSMPLSLQPRLVVMNKLPTTANLKADRVKLSKWETLQEAEKAQPQPAVAASAAPVPEPSPTPSIAASTEIGSPLPSPSSIASPLSPPSADNEVFLSPSLVRDSLEIALHVVYRGVLGESFDPAARLFDDLGLSSMAATRLINLINDAFQCQLPGSVLWSHQTLYAMATLLRQNNFLRPSDVLLPLSQRAMERDDEWSGDESGDAPGVALVLVYSAGGGAVHYLAFARAISDALPSLAVFALERAEGAPESQLQTHAHEISKRLAGVPVVLCGFSSGGSIAYELAQMLPAFDVPVQSIVMMDTPHEPTIVQPGYVLGNLMRTTLQRSAIAAKKPVSTDELEQRVATFRSTLYRMLEEPSAEALEHVYELAASQFVIEPFKQPSFLRNFVENSQQDCLYVKQHIHPKHKPLVDNQISVHFLAAVLESDPTLGLPAAHVWRERSASKHFKICHINADHQKLLMHPETKQAVIEATMPYRTAHTSMPRLASPISSPKATPQTAPIPPKQFAFDTPSVSVSAASVSPPLVGLQLSPISSAASSPTSFTMVSPRFSPTLMAAKSLSPPAVEVARLAPSPSPSLPVTFTQVTSLHTMALMQQQQQKEQPPSDELMHVRHVPIIKTVHMPTCIVGNTPERLSRELHGLMQSVPNIRRMVAAATTSAGLMSVFQQAVPFSQKEAANSELFHDNLDTGNSCMEPIESVQAAMTMTTSNDMRRYQPPEPTEQLRASVLMLMQHLGLLSRPPNGGVTNKFDVVVGPGTSFFMHSLCSLLIQRTGDAVLLPTPGYGLFLPAVEEVGGQCAFVHIDERTEYKLTAAELQRAIRDTNKRLMDNWLATLAEELTVMRRRLIRAGLLEDNIDSQDALYAAEQAVRSELTNAGALAYAQGAADRVDRVLRRFVNVDLLNGTPAHLSVLESMRAIVPSPPRVVAYLHVNPDTFGRCYTADMCRPLAQVLADANVAVMEDLAYAMVQHDLTTNQFKLKSASFLEAEKWDAPVQSSPVHSPGAFRPRPLSSLRVYCMLGFSKGLSIPGLRLGALVCPVALAPPLFTRVFTSVGFVASSLQRALHHLCRSLPQQLHTYLARNAVEWTLRRTVFLALVAGVGSLQLQNELQSASVDLLRPLLSESCSAIWDSLASFRPWSSPESMADSMLNDGLRKFFNVVCVPEAGFFCLLDSAPLRARSIQWTRGGERLASAMEVCVFLKQICGIKTIPEEALGLPLTLENGRRKFDETHSSAGTHDGRTATLLRFSFSVSLPRLIQLLTQMHVQLNRLEHLHGTHTLAQ
jgi:aspartate/methionine/tyrosine aminotransferase/thioesterase domain-containing protein/acyl carrier protein